MARFQLEDARIAAFALGKVWRNIIKQPLGQVTAIIHSACHKTLSMHDRAGVAEHAVAASPAIVECRSTTGESDYLMTVLVPDIRAYERFLHDTLFRLPGITPVRSAMTPVTSMKTGGSA